MKEEYPSDWDSRRRKVYQRDDYTCQNCGASGGPHGNAELHAHHVVPRSDGGSDNVDNLQTLCKDCHHAIHHDDKLAPTAELSDRATARDSPPGPLAGALFFGSVPCLFLLFVTPFLGVEIPGSVYVFVFASITGFSYYHKDKWHREHVE